MPCFSSPLSHHILQLLQGIIAYRIYDEVRPFLRRLQKTGKIYHIAVVVLRLLRVQHALIRVFRWFPLFQKIIRH